VFANNRYYVLGGWTTPLTGGNFDPSPGSGAGVYADNRQSGVSVYNPNTDTWSSSKWDGTGPHPQTLYTDTFVSARPMQSGQCVPPPVFITGPTRSDLFPPYPIEDYWGFKLWNLTAGGTSLRYQLYYRDLNTPYPIPIPPPPVMVPWWASAYVMKVQIGFGVPGVAGPPVKVLWEDSDGLPNSGVGDWAGAATGFWTGITPADLTALQNGECYVEIVGDDGSALPAPGNQEAFLRGQLIYLRTREHYTATSLFGHVVGAPAIAQPPQFLLTDYVNDSTDQDPTYVLKMRVGVDTGWWQTNVLAPAFETITKVYLKQKSTGTVLLTVWDSTLAGTGPPTGIGQVWSDIGCLSDPGTYFWWEALTPATAALIEAEDTVTEIWTDNASPGGPDVLKAGGRPQVQYDPADLPRTDDGFACGHANAVAYDRDGDAVKEIYATSGYPNWGGYIQIYNPADNTWTQSADHPAFLSGGNLAHYRGPFVLHGDWIYRVNGAFYDNKAARYNIPENRWELGNESMSLNVTGGASAGPMTFPDGNDYLVATFNELGNTEIYKYNLTSAAAGNFTTEDWVYSHRLVAGTSLNRPSGFMFDNKFYVVGEATETTPNKVWVYDGTADATQVVGADMPLGASRAGIGVDPLCGTVYYGGGQQQRNAGDTANIAHSTLWTYNLLGLPSALVGDSNCDGAVDFDDISPFVAALVGEAGWKSRVPVACQAGYVCLNDINRDGAVNFDDISPFVKCLVLGGCP
jgi:hypothetical protein